MLRPFHSNIARQQDCFKIAVTTRQILEHFFASLHSSFFFIVVHTDTQNSAIPLSCSTTYTQRPVIITKEEERERESVCVKGMCVLYAPNNNLFNTMCHTLFGCLEMENAEQQKKRSVEQKKSYSYIIHITQ